MSPEQPSTKIGKSVGEKLRAARIAQHYTQSQLAAPDFSVSYISAIERGQIHPSLRALEILAGRLGMTSTQLLPNKAQQDERALAAANLSEREEDEVDYSLLEAQVAINQGNAEEAVEKLESLGRRRLKRQQYLQQRYLLGCAYYTTARYQESEYTLSESIQVAKELGAQYLHLRILHQLACVYGAMRNYTQALLADQRSLSLLEEGEIRDPFFAAQIYIQMGQHYSRLGNMEQSLEMFHAALEQTANLIKPEHIQEFYTDTAQSYIEQKENRLASLYLYKNTNLTHQHKLKHLRGELHYYLGQAILRNDYLGARDYLDTELDQAGEHKDDLTHASLLTRDAEWYFFQKDMVQAEKQALKAYTLVQAAGDSIIAADALIILGRIEYENKQYEEGSRNLAAGLDMLERLGNHEELADESVRYAQLLEDIGHEREAFTHFRRAFQSRQKLGK